MAECINRNHPISVVRIKKLLHSLLNSISVFCYSVMSPFLQYGGMFHNDCSLHMFLQVCQARQNVTYNPGFLCTVILVLYCATDQRGSTQRIRQFQSWDSSHGLLCSSASQQDNRPWFILRRFPVYDQGSASFSQLLGHSQRTTEVVTFILNKHGRHKKALG